MNWKPSHGLEILIIVPFFSSILYSINHNLSYVFLFIYFLLKKSSKFKKEKNLTRDIPTTCYSIQTIIIKIVPKIDLAGEFVH